MASLEEPDLALLQVRYAYGLLLHEPTKFLSFCQFELIFCSSQYKSHLTLELFICELGFYETPLKSKQEKYTYISILVLDQ